MHWLNTLAESALSLQQHPLSGACGETKEELVTLMLVA